MADNFNPLSANPTKWSKTLKQFVGKLSTNSLSVFDHFVNLTLKGLKKDLIKSVNWKYEICVFATLKHINDNKTFMEPLNKMKK